MGGRERGRRLSSGPVSSPEPDPAVGGHCAQVWRPHLCPSRLEGRRVGRRKQVSQGQKCGGGFPGSLLVDMAQRVPPGELWSRGILRSHPKGP